MTEASQGANCFEELVKYLLMVRTMLWGPGGQIVVDIRNPGYWQYLKVPILSFSGHDLTHVDVLNFDSCLHYMSSAGRVPERAWCLQLPTLLLILITATACTRSRQHALHTHLPGLSRYWCSQTWTWSWCTSHLVHACPVLTAVAITNARTQLCLELSSPCWPTDACPPPILFVCLPLPGSQEDQGAPCGH